MPINDFSKYLLTRPMVSTEIKYPLKDFFMRSIVQDPTTNITGIITEVTEQVEGEVDHVPIIFDINVFWDGELSPEDEKIWDLLDKIRDTKNNLFFNSFTEDVKRRFR